MTRRPDGVTRYTEQTTSAKGTTRGMTTATAKRFAWRRECGEVPWHSHLSKFCGRTSMLRPSAWQVQARLTDELTVCARAPEAAVALVRLMLAVNAEAVCTSDALLHVRVTPCSKKGDAERKRQRSMKKCEPAAAGMHTRRNPHRLQQLPSSRTPPLSSSAAKCH